MRTPDSSSHRPTPPGLATQPSRGSTWARRAGAVGIVAGLGLAGVFVVRSIDGGAATYRTADVETRDIDALHTGVATIEPVNQAKIGFPSAGTVSSVEVAVGDVVTVGQQLATLDTLELERTLREKQEVLTQAQLVLSVALDGDDPSSLLQGSAQATPMGFASPSATTSSTTSLGATSTTSALAFAVSPVVAAANLSITGASDPELAAAQQAVLDAQRAVDAATVDAATAMDAATAVCTDIVGAVDPVAAVAACQTALGAVTTAQAAVTTAQTTLTAAAAVLDTLLGQWADELAAATEPTTTDPSTPSTTKPSTTDPSTTDPSTTDPSTTQPSTTAPGTPGGTDRAPSTTDDGSETTEAGAASTPSGGSGRTSAPSSGGNTGGSAGSSGATPTSEDLIAYQYDVDAAEYALEAARQALAQATIVSPISGTVSAVDLEVGTDVAAASTTEVVVVESPRGYEATTIVGINDIADIAVGQTATVVPDGTDQTISGVVGGISSIPDGASSGYRVTIGFDDADGEYTAALNSGNIASVSIVTSSTSGGIAVPTSAVTLRGTQHVVTVLDDDGTISVAPVTIGVVGPAYTEVLSGIDEHTTVVLAQLS